MKRLISRLLEPASKVLVDAIRAKVWILSGKERSSGLPFNVIYAGEDVQKNYIAHLLYGSDHESRFLGSRNPWSLHRLTRHGGEDAAMMIIEGHAFHRRFYGTKNDFWIPRWLDFVADIPLVAIHKTSRADLRMVRDNALDYEVTSKPDLLSEFYHSMYLPTMAVRHQDRAITMSLEDMMASAQKGECKLLLVKKAGQAIAGVLISHEEKRPRLWSAGILNGDPQYWKDRAIAGTYYFPSVYLAEQGYDSLHVGSARPFFTDGVLAYKIKWNVRAQVEALRGFLLKPLVPSKALNAFLVANPFIGLQNGAPRATVFQESEQNLTEDKRNSLKKKYLLNGLSGVDIYRLSPEEDFWTIGSVLENAVEAISNDDGKASASSIETMKTATPVR